jgi:hypothetical protein
MYFSQNYVNTYYANFDVGLCKCRLARSALPVRKAQKYGRAIAQAVSRWLSTATTRAQARVWSSGICGGQSGTGADFLRELWFPLPIFVLPNSPSQSPRASTIGQKWPTSRMDPVWTSPPTMRIKKKRYIYY